MFLRCRWNKEVQNRLIDSIVFEIYCSRFNFQSRFFFKLNFSIYSSNQCSPLQNVVKLVSSQKRLSCLSIVIYNDFRIHKRKILHDLIFLNYRTMTMTLLYLSFIYDLKRFIRQMSLFKDRLTLEGCLVPENGLTLLKLPQLSKISKI